VGISSWEGLWCRFEGDDPAMRELRAWAPAYRRGAWAAALADQGVVDDELAVLLGERFGVERRARMETFADAEPALRALSASFRLGVVTNGAACLQREKLAASGLSSFFDAVVVSAEVGVAKPDARVFEAALSALGVDCVVMVGDSLRRDVEGARAAGLDAIWLNRAGSEVPRGVRSIGSLAELAVGSRS
jgi:putative hydrolase of the HAD superfamily